jgi:RNA polymerase sigma factor, sigma-70 family
MNDQEIIGRLQAGNEEAYKEIVEKYQRYVLNTCYRFVNSEETAEDLTQEVFIQIFFSIREFRGESKLSTWIYRIAVTKSLDHIKKSRRKKRFAVLKRLFGEDEMEEQIPSSDDANPEKEFDDKERLKILNVALDSLPENQRIAFTLSKYDELSYKEIADILGTTISAVESLIHRAKNNLQKKLYNYYKKHLEA